MKEQSEIIEKNINIIQLAIGNYNHKSPSQFILENFYY